MRRGDLEAEVIEKGGVGRGQRDDAWVHGSWSYYVVKADWVMLQV